jgi:hypothetical protein
MLSGICGMREGYIPTKSTSTIGFAIGSVKPKEADTVYNCEASVLSQEK